MRLEQVKQIVGDTPHMTIEQANRMAELLRSCHAKDVLELGFEYGVSTCYIAATLAEMGGGTVTSIDLESARARTPNIEQLLDRCKLRDMVTIYYEPTSYAWRLMKFLQEGQDLRFDFCYLDAAHSWFVDGFGFLLVDRLLRPGGWIVFDDLDWTFDDSEALRRQDWVKAMPKEERETPQVRMVYELLVKGHPNYGNFRVERGWGYAQKMMQADGTPCPASGGRAPMSGLGFTVKRIARRIKRAIRAS